LRVVNTLSAAEMLHYYPLYRVAQKMAHLRKFVIDFTTPQMYRYTTLLNVNVLKQQLKTRLL